MKVDRALRARCQQCSLERLFHCVRKLARDWFLIRDAGIISLTGVQQPIQSNALRLFPADNQLKKTYL